MDSSMIGSVMQFHIDSTDPETFVVGQLVYLGDEWFLIQSIAPSGHWDGIMLLLCSDVVAVDTHSEYLQKMGRLLPWRGTVPSAFPRLHDEPLPELLNWAITTGMFVALELHMSGTRDVVGCVRSCREGMVCVEQVDEYGFPDGISFVSIPSVNRCFLGDDDLQCLQFLARNPAPNEKMGTV